MAQEEQVTKESTRAKRVAPSADADLVLRDAQNWSSRSHRELYEAVHQGNEPGRVGELAQDWARMGTEIGESSQRMAERLRGTEEGWQGEAAQSARGAIHELARWTSDAGTTAGHLGQRIGEQGQVMEVAKASMPEPKDVEFRDEIVAAYSFAGGGSEASALAGILRASADMKVQQDKADSAHAQAVAVMEQMESESRVLDGRTPRFEPPPDPIREGTKTGSMSASPRARVQPHELSTGTPMSTESTGVAQPREAPGAPLGGPGAPGGEQPDQRSGPGAPVPPPGDSQPGGADATKRMPALNTSASSGPTSAPPLESPTQTYGDKGGSGPTPGGSGARVPKLEDFDGGGKNQGGRPLDQEGSGPARTTPQGTGPAGTPLPTGGDQPTIRRPVPPLDGTNIGGGPIVPGGRGPAGKPGGGNGSGPDGRSGWSGAIPPIPSTSGSGSGGPLGSGGSGGSSGPAGPPGSGGSGGSNVGAGGRSSVGTGSGGGPGGEPVGGPGSGGTPGTSGSAGTGGMGAPGAAAGRGRGGEDEERRAKYVESTPIVEVPGAELPPPVIGGGKPKKKDG